MKIAFWSNVRGQCGTTLHLTSIAIIQAMFDKKKVVLMENHDHLLNIESCLVKKGRSDMVMEVREFITGTVWKICLRLLILLHQK